MALASAATSPQPQSPKPQLQQLRINPPPPQQQQQLHTLASPYTSRPGSVCSNDRWSVLSGPQVPITMMPNPPPAYVAAAAASQMVVDHSLKSTAPDELDDLLPPDTAEDGTAGTLFSGDALGLLNGFLDQTLYSILATAKSGKLKKLRPAITEVLRPKMARVAIACADEELRELLDGEDEDDEDDGTPPVADSVSDLRNGAVDSGFNLALTWKRTRLRIMVYTRLGDLEDEDEDRFLDDDEEFHAAKENAAGIAASDADPDAIADLGLVSPAAAIFLTSVIEYLAEQTIVVAGTASLHRTQKARNAAQAAQAEKPKLMVVDVDMEKVALNPTLGRLWRTWRKRSRSSTTLNTPYSPSRRGHFGSMNSRSPVSESHAWSEAGSRRPSLAVGDMEAKDKLKGDAVPDMREHSEHELASNIALPLPEGGNDRDVKEIEIPGLAREIVDEPGPEPAGTEEEKGLKRRASFMQSNLLATRALLEEGGRPALKRIRSNSAPHADAEKPQTWLEWLMGQSPHEHDEAAAKQKGESDDTVKGVADSVNVEKESEEAVVDDGEGDHGAKTAEAEAETAAAEDEQTQKKKAYRTGFVAGATAVIGSVIGGVVGTRANESEERHAESETETGAAKDAQVETVTAKDAVDAGGAVDVPQGEDVAEKADDGVPIGTAVPYLPPRSKVAIEQEAALRAAEQHVKRLSFIQPAQPSSRDTSCSRAVAESGKEPDEDDCVRPQHQPAVAAPLAAEKEVDGSARNFDEPASVKGPTVPPKSMKYSPSHFKNSPKRTHSKRARAAGVNDDYDPFSSVAYKPTKSRTPPPQAQQGEQPPSQDAHGFDASAIGVARSSDHAIPYSRSPSPQGRKSCLRDAKGAQGSVRNVSGAAVASFSPSGPREAPEHRPQSAHRGESGLQGHKDVNSFATKPLRDDERVQQALQSPVRSSGRSTTSSRREEADGGEKHHQQQQAQAGAQEKSAHLLRSPSALQRISNASEQVPDRSIWRKQVVETAAVATGGGVAVVAAQQHHQRQHASQRTGSFEKSRASITPVVRPGSSKGTGLRPRGSTGSANEIPRSSKEGDGLMPRPVDASGASTENKRRDFEELLNSGESETVKYTLTPVRVSAENPVVAATTLKSDKQAGTPASPVKSSAKYDASSGKTSLVRSPSQTTPSLSSRYSASSLQQVRYSTIPTHSNSRKGKQTSIPRVPGPRPINTSTSFPRRVSVGSPTGGTDLNVGASQAAQEPVSTKKKVLKFIAREPRVRQESLRDFADFIRTTGPDKEMNVVPIIQNSGSHARSRSSSGPSGSGNMLNGLAAHSSRPASNRNSAGDVLSMGSGSSKRLARHRTSMQARDPSVKADGSKDLIRFLREGPPDGQAQQPKFVAPFANASGRKGSRAGRESDELVSPMTSSRNSTAPSPTSRTGLLPVGAAGGSAGGIDGLKKSRRRVKDPYAIDLSDEDEDLLTALPGAPGAGGQRNDESLIDFLRNSEPPKSNEPLPLSVGVGPGVAPAGTNGSVARPSTNGSTSGARRMETRPAGATSNARAVRKEASQNTKDLAEFLRDSGPPGAGSSGKTAKMMGGMDVPPAAVRSGSKASGGGSGGRFWKRKNTVEG